MFCLGFGTLFEHQRTVSAAVMTYLWAEGVKVDEIDQESRECEIHCKYLTESSEQAVTSLKPIVLQHNYWAVNICCYVVTLFYCIFVRILSVTFFHTYPQSDITLILCFLTAAEVFKFTVIQDISTLAELINYAG